MHSCWRFLIDLPMISPWLLPSCSFSARRLASFSSSAAASLQIWKNTYYLQSWEVKVSKVGGFTKNQSNGVLLIESDYRWQKTSGYENKPGKVVQVSKASDLQAFISQLRVLSKSQRCVKPRLLFQALRGLRESECWTSILRRYQAICERIVSLDMGPWKNSNSRTVLFPHFF